MIRIFFALSNFHFYFEDSLSLLHFNFHAAKYSKSTNLLLAQITAFLFHRAERNFLSGQTPTHPQSQVKILDCLESERGKIFFL